MKDQIEALYRVYMSHLTEEQIAKIIVQSLLLRMIEGDKDYVSSSQLTMTALNLGNEHKDRFGYLLDPNVFMTDKAIYIYNQVKSFDLSSSSIDDLGIIFEGLMSRADAQKLGAFYTPPSLAMLVIKIALLGKNRDIKIYDPAMGTAGLLLLAHKHVSRVMEHCDVEYYGQEFNPTSWKVACINALLYQMDYHFGWRPGDTISNPLHPDLRADIILANPPYNQKGWDIHLNLSTDPRFKDLPKPPSNNGNFAWILHCLYHLKDDGIACIIMANGALTTSQKDELAVREYLVKQDLVEAIITLPPKLFMSTSIPCSIWVINKAKARAGKMLLIDLASQGTPINRKQNEIRDEVIERVIDQLGKWRAGEEIEKLAFLVDIDHATVKDKKFSLSPGQYQEVDTTYESLSEQSFMEKISQMIYDFERLAEEEKRLTAQVIANLKNLKYGDADNDER